MCKFSSHNVPGFANVTVQQSGGRTMKMSLSRVISNEEGKESAMHCSALQCISAQYCVVQCNTVQCNAQLQGAVQHCAE